MRDSIVYLYYYYYYHSPCLFNLLSRLPGAFAVRRPTSWQAQKPRQATETLPHCYWCLSWSNRWVVWSSSPLRKKGQERGAGRARIWYDGARSGCPGVWDILSHEGHLLERLEAGTRIATIKSQAPFNIPTRTAAGKGSSPPAFRPALLGKEDLDLFVKD